MVEPPRLRVQFDAREKIIPIIFDKYCKGKFTLEIIPPEKEDDPKPGPIPRPTFRVLDKSCDLLAHFNPWGGAKCHDKDFIDTFELMKKDIEKAAQDALDEFTRI
ncbi:MAG: hypothetical protein FK733_17870 [Asgard group archaeon]|nr:hypothetical protein [Asgard group archaeon]